MPSLLLLVNTCEPQSINAKLVLPIIPIGIVAYAFTLLWYNLCRNSCMANESTIKCGHWGKRISLQAFVKQVEHAGLREEDQKRGLGSSIDIKLCRLEKGPDGNKAYAINTQAQWDEERSMISNRGMVLQGSSYYNNYRHCIVVTQHVFHT